MFTKRPTPAAAVSSAAFSPKMSIPVSAQLLTFFLALLSGASFALVYDLFAAVRRRFSSHLATALLDGFYCLCAALALFLLTLDLGDGRPRLYLLLAIVLGAAMYFLLPAPYFRPVWNFWLECFFLALAFGNAPRRFLLHLGQKIWRSCKKLFYFSKKYAIILFCKPWSAKEKQQWRKRRPQKRKQV